MNEIWALVPVKAFGHSKSRLASALGAAERAELARYMMCDVLSAIAAAPDVNGVAVMTRDTAVAAAAEPFGCRLIPDADAKDVSASLESAVAGLAASGAVTVIILPADLPGLTADDIAALLGSHRQGVTVVPATADGGTNALAMTPPTAGKCLFGPDSAQRHLAAARLRGVAAVLLPLPGFARDIDTVDDVRWLCAQPGGGATREYLETSGICARLTGRELEHHG